MTGVEPSTATAAFSEPVLVETKLHAPARRPGVVSRPELLTRLVAGRARKLTLVCAPAGGGKSTLLGAWCASPEEARPFAWVLLDPSDSDPVRFWRYVIGALRSVRPGLGTVPLAALGSAGRDVVDVVVAPLINELAALPAPLVLVLDDYHLLRGEAVHASVGFLLRHLPATLHVAIASRGDPGLPVGALRAAGEVTEIRVADLRFDAEEAAELLNGSLDLGLDPADVERLRSRTEGWAAGLQLAALSARTTEDRHAFARDFAGSDRLIGDYLREVLADQPPARRDFLLRHNDLVTTELLPAPALAPGGSLSLDLVPGRTFAIPIAATAGESISISTSIRDFWDSIAVLQAPDGTPVVGSDDANKYFAAFDWVAQETGTYTLQVTSFESVRTGKLVVTRG